MVSFFFSLVQQYNSLLVEAKNFPTSAPSLNKLIATPFLQVFEVVTVFLVPLVTMGVFADEKQKGTFSLLATAPISSWQLVLGKYLGVALFLDIIYITSCLPLFLLLILLSAEVLPIVVGFCFIYLFALSLAALSLAISASSQNFVSAGVFSVIFCLVLFVVDAPASGLSSSVAEVLRWLSPSSHMDFPSRGLITSGDLIYFVTLILLGLFATTRIIEQQRG